MTRNERIVL